MQNYNKVMHIIVKSYENIAIAINMNMVNTLRQQILLTLSL